MRGQLSAGLGPARWNLHGDEFTQRLLEGLSAEKLNGLPADFLVVTEVAVGELSARPSRMSSERRPVPATTRIEVCGGIASGKTSFARLFKGSPIRPVFETFRANPFWRKFLSAPLEYAFETEISFMLHHSHQIKEASVGVGRRGLISDFSIFLDLAYARVALRARRFRVFNTVWAEVAEEVRLPTLLVYLQCDARTELNRIRARGRAEESTISLRYLRLLNSAIRSEMAKIEERVHVLRVDSAHCNFIRDADIKRVVRARVFEMISGGSSGQPERSQKLR